MGAERLPTWRRLHAISLRTGALALFVVGGILGCEQAPARQVPKFSADTPEQKLELVMERFDSALGDAAAAQGSGVVSQRKSSHRLIPPSADDDSYRAEVTIQTTVSLAHAPAALDLPSKKEAKPLATVSEEDDSVEFKPKDEPAEADETIMDNGVTPKAIEQSKNVKTDVYNLVYVDDRWTMPEEPTDEVAKYLFDFALQK